MMLKESLESIEIAMNQIILSSAKISLVSAGCSMILSWLTLFPGSSKSVIETINPYQREKTIELIGFCPKQFVS